MTKFMKRLFGYHQKAANVSAADGYFNSGEGLTMTMLTVTATTSPHSI